MSELAVQLDHFGNHRMLCIGDVMLDRYVYGEVERISPEAPIPVLRAQRENAMLGGAGNVVRNIAALGGAVSFISVVGADQTASDLSDVFKIFPTITAHLLTDATRPTTQKTRFVAGTQQLLRTDHEIATPISADLEHKMIEAVTKDIAACACVILSDYAKGVLTPRVITETIKQARAADKIILIDPKARDFGIYRDATILTPNRKELSEAIGHKINSVAEAEQAARQLMRDFAIDNILVKLGADGVCLVSNNQPAQHFHAQAREVFDVSGAGDTVLATLALGLASGLPPATAAELANIAGSIVVGKVGTATVTRDEIARELMHGDSASAEGKIVGSGSAADNAERWRAQGFKVGFTNGCFDLLHPGHISMIRQARAACDKLIVGLNSDASVKRLKGETRPVQNENARATVLASLADVDQVVIFGEDTPLELVKTIRPDVMIKGADYTIDKIAGAREVIGWGGKVVLAQLVEGQSTTKTIAKMAAK